MRAVKGNKVYTIDDTQKKNYQDMGFDILDDDGGVVAYGRGKTVPYDDHIKAVKEIERLQQLIADQNAEITELKSVQQEPQGVEKKAGTKKVGD